MTSDSAPRATTTGECTKVWQSWLRVLWPLCHGVAGFLFGLFVLHPAAMVIFRWFDPRLAHGAHEHESGSLLSPVLHSFNSEMAPMALVFGLFSGAIALINGYYRHRLALQRDELAYQADLLARKNRQLTKLERTNRRHVQFMVHDFKGHLATIGGFAEHLIEKNASTWAPVDVEALERIRRQSLRMAGAVMDLLEFAHLQESTALRLERASVAALLETAASDLSLPTKLGAVELGPLHGDCPEVIVDIRIIGRVLSNLALNALKHNGPGTHVVVDAQPAPDGGDVAFTCTDDGRGLSSAARGSLFEEFAGGGDTEAEDSTGLGLAFCKAAVEAHGGRISFESSEGRGTRFVFTVPRAKEAAPMATSGSRTSSSLTTTPTPPRVPE